MDKPYNNNVIMFLSNLLGTNTPNPSEQASGGKSGMKFKFLVFSILTALSLWGAPTTTCGSDNTATDNAESILASEATATDAPTIQAEFADNNLVLTFTGNLESSIDGINWIAIETPSPYTVKPTGKKRLFRAVSAGQKTKIIEIEISDESAKHRDEIFAACDILGKSDEELLKRFVENSLPKLLARTEQKFPTVKTKNKLEKQTSEFGDVYTLTGDKEDCIIYYIHGGAWVSEIDKLHVEFCDKLVDALDAKVYMPIYPLAPQATYKEGYQMIESVYDDLLKLNKPIFIMGDSAGGNIALNFVSQLKEKGKPLPEKIVVMAPCADMSFSNPKIKEYAKVDGELPRVECLACAELWADGTDLKDPILSPLYADVTGFPDTMFIQGTYDILYPDTMALFDKMCASGVNTTFIKGIGFWHVFPVSNIKEQQQTIDLITKFCPIKTLPQEISQDDWNDARQYVNLPTGLKMSYVEMGNPYGPVMILQHGTTDNSRVWSLAAPYLCQADYHLYITDMRGQGFSSQPDGFYTFIDYACDTEAFMDAKHIDKAIMVGQSLGSIMMQAFAIMFPSRCEKVVLVGSGVADETYAASFNTAYAYIFNLPDDMHPSDEFIDRWYTTECEVPEDFMTYVKKESQQLPLRVWKNIFGGGASMNLMDMYQYFDSSIPTLIMHGEKDSMLGEEHQKKLKKSLPFADYIEYKGVGHNVHFEIPEEFAEDLIDWVQK